MPVRHEKDAAGRIFKSTYPVEEIPLNIRHKAIVGMIEAEIGQTPKDSKSNREIRIFSQGEQVARLSPPILQGLKQDTNPSASHQDDLQYLLYKGRRDLWRKEFIGDFARRAMRAEHIIFRQNPEIE